MIVDKRKAAVYRSELAWRQSQSFRANELFCLSLRRRFADVRQSTENFEGIAWARSPEPNMTLCEGDQP
jgi:hypothetical protein